MTKHQQNRTQGSTCGSWCLVQNVTLLHNNHQSSDEIELSQCANDPCGVLDKKSTSFASAAMTGTTLDKVATQYGCGRRHATPNSLRTQSGIGADSNNCDRKTTSMWWPPSRKRWPEKRNRHEPHSSCLIRWHLVPRATRATPHRDPARQWPPRSWALGSRRRNTSEKLMTRVER